MTIQPINECDLALFIGKSDLELRGLSPDTLSISDARQMAYEAFAKSAGFTPTPLTQFENKNSQKRIINELGRFMQSARLRCCLAYKNGEKNKRQFSRKIKYYNTNILTTVDAPLGSLQRAV